MLANIPPEISIASFSLLGILTGYIWNDQNKRISVLEKEQKECAVPAIKQDIAQIKNDISWLKEFLIKD